jgi:hypothetical protein
MNSHSVDTLCRGITDSESHEYAAVDGGKHNYGGYGFGKKAGRDDSQVNKDRKNLSDVLGLKAPPKKGQRVLSRAEALEQVQYSLCHSAPIMLMLTSCCTFRISYSSLQKWRYVDGTGKTQGPFSSSQMGLWYDQGALPEELDVILEEDAQGEGGGTIAIWALRELVGGHPFKTSNAVVLPKEEVKGALGALAGSYGDDADDDGDNE